MDGEPVDPHRPVCAGRTDPSRRHSARGHRAGGGRARTRWTCAPTVRTRSSAAPPAPARASCCSRGSWRWRPRTARSGSPSCSSTTRAAPRSADCVDLPHTVGLVTDLTPAPRASRADLAAAELRYREHVLAQHRRQGPRRARDAGRRPGCAAEPGDRRRRVRRPRQRGARVRRRRRRRRPARPLARAAPDPGDAAPGRRHQGQPAGEHQPAGRAADGRRGTTAPTSSDRRRPRSSTRRCPGGRCPRPAPVASFRSRPATPAAGRATSRRRPRSSSRSSIFGVRAGVGAAAKSDVAVSDPGPPTSSASSRSAFGRGEAPRSRSPQAVAARAGADLRPRRPDARCRLGAATTSWSSASRTIPSDQAQPPVAFHPDRDGNLVVYGTGGSGKCTSAAHHRGRGRLHGARRAVPRLRPRLRRPGPGDARGAAARRQHHPGDRPRARGSAAHLAAASSSTSARCATRRANAGTITDYRRAMACRGRTADPAARRRHRGVPAGVRGRAAQQMVRDARRYRDGRTPGRCPRRPLGGPSERCAVGARVRGATPCCPSDG